MTVHVPDGFDEWVSDPSDANLAMIYHLSDDGRVAGVNAVKRAVIEALAQEAERWYETSDWEGPIGVEFYGVADWIRSHMPEVTA